MLFFEAFDLNSRRLQLGSETRELLRPLHYFIRLTVLHVEPLVVSQQNLRLLAVSCEHHGLFLHRVGEVLDLVLQLHRVLLRALQLLSQVVVLLLVLLTVVR